MVDWLMSKYKLPNKPGIYTLVIEVNQPVKLKIGKLGRIDFDYGFYAYTGSALGRTLNLKTRINRHLATVKKKHWHIDYLLISKNVAIKAIIYVETHFRKECQVASNIESFAMSNAQIRGFGSSDCLYRCKSHLSYFNLSFSDIQPRVINVYEQQFTNSPSVILL